MEEIRNSVTLLVSGLKKQSELIGRHIHHALCGARWRILCDSER